MLRLTLFAALLSLSACEPAAPGSSDGGSSDASGFNGGFERVSAAGVPDGWTSSCAWDGQVLVTTGAAASGEQGLRMYGGCTVTSSFVPAPSSAVSVTLAFTARTAANDSAVVTATWRNASGASLSAGFVSPQKVTDRSFTTYTVDVQRPAGGASVVVAISTPDTSTVTVDFDDVALSFQ